ncbi:ABC transporter substrate-binding protein [soil metagenome]
MRTGLGKTRVAALALALALLAAACGGGDGDGDDTAGGEETGGDTATDAGGDADAGDDTATDAGTGAATDTEDESAGDGATLTFGTSNDPVVLDGILVSDGESLRVIDQMFEGLVTLESGGTEIAPGLATEWESSEDGLEWTFTLRDGVTFHDGEPFNAEAVCFNFDRWYNFTGTFQNPDATYYWQTQFGGFAENEVEGVPEDNLYESCEAPDETTVVMNLTRPSAAFLSSLSLTNFTMASPAALEEFGADEGEVGDDGIFRPSGTYGTEHPTGTGPFRFVEWTRNQRLVLERNPDYWGEFPGNIQNLIFTPIPENAARLQALQAGDIDGYDLVDPQDFETISGDENLQLLERPAFNVGYLGFAQQNEPLDDLEVRKAIAHAINRQELVDAFYAGQGEVATQFMPPALFGYADDVTTYDYDPEMAQQILEDAGYELPVEVSFGYPTDVSRPYMPNPQQNFEAMVADLEECCFTVQQESSIWSPDYLSQTNQGAYGLYLLGWTGDVGDPANFLGTFFGSEQGQWGFDNQEIFDLLAEAEAETDEAARTELYEEANRVIMDFLPGLPYVHTKPALAFSANVTGYEPSPVSLEPFSIVTVGE